MFSAIVSKIRIEKKDEVVMVKGRNHLNVIINNFKRFCFFSDAFRKAYYEITVTNSRTQREKLKQQDVKKNK